MINKQTTLGELEKIFFEDLRTTQTDEYDLVLDEEEFRKLFMEALTKYILGEYVDIEAIILAYKVYYIEYEEYLPYSIAGIYAGSYTKTEEVYEDTRVYVKAYLTEDGELDFYVEEVG